MARRGHIHPTHRMSAYDRSSPYGPPSHGGWMGGGGGGRSSGGGGGGYGMHHPAVLPYHHQMPITRGGMTERGGVSNIR